MEGEKLVNKIACFSKAAKKDSQTAKKILAENFNSNGYSNNPSKRIILKYMKDEIIEEYRRIMNIKVKEDLSTKKILYPTFQLNLYNLFDIEEGEYLDPDTPLLAFLTKRREATFVLYLSNHYARSISGLDRDGATITTSFDSMWRLKNSRAVKSLNLNYQDCINAIREEMGFEISEESKLNGIKYPNFLMERSWFSIIFTDLAEEKQKTCQLKIDEIDQFTKKKGVS